VAQGGGTEGVVLVSLEAWLQGAHGQGACDGEPLPGGGRGARGRRGGRGLEGA